MFYWNQTNFEGLKSIGNAYLSMPGYEDFANYCITKEQGLKNQANKFIDDFVSNIESWNTEEQRKLAQEITSLWFWHQEVHQLLSHPLKQFILKILKEWCESEPNNAVAHRWLGCLGGGLEYFEKALENDATDQISIYQLALAYLDDANYITHHLSESKLLGTEEELATAIDKARNYANILKTTELKKEIQDEIDCYAELFLAWKHYRIEKPALTFPEWAKSQNHEYKFCSIVYYD